MISYREISRREIFERTLALSALVPRIAMAANPKDNVDVFLRCTGEQDPPKARVIGIGITAVRLYPHVQGNRDTLLSVCYRDW